MFRDYLTRLLEAGTLQYRNKGNRHLVAVAVDLRRSTSNAIADSRTLDRNPVLRPSPSRLHDGLL